MATVQFSPNFRRHVACPTLDVAGDTVGAVLESVFRDNAELRGYVLDDRGEVRKHIAVFLNGKPIEDRIRLTDSVAQADEIFVMQALSGG
jgi:sulfur carrier protein ThiS